MILQADAKHMPIANKSVQTVVTSPPYWGLRDYGVTGQIGLESTPEEYVETMVQIFREVRRILRDNGTVWLNLGDSYAGNRGNSSEHPGYDNKAAKGHANLNYNSNKIVSGLKPKDLVGIPWRVAFALQADGWCLRSDIIWSKPNPMPESVTDRPTKAHEYLFLLSKSEQYYYDKDAIAEPIANSSVKRIAQPTFYQQDGGEKDYGKTGVNENRSMRKTIENFEKKFRGYKTKNGEVHFGNEQHHGQDIKHGIKRNKRTVWEITTKPYPDAHFAVYPPQLIAPCVKAGSAKGDIVLDPFVGSGTTLEVAHRLDRYGVGLDLSSEYCQLAQQRIRPLKQQQNLFHSPPEARHG